MIKKWLIGLFALIFIFILSIIIYLGAPYDPDKSDYFDAEPPENLVRTIHNPDAQNTVTFRKMSHETDGEYTLLEIDLSPGGGNSLHYHERFSETFTAVKGITGVEVDGEEYFLDENESIKAEAGAIHRFFNSGDESVKFEVKIEPGSPGFEKALYILYGLANDGLTNDEGTPKDINHIGIFVAYSDTRGTGLQGLILGSVINRIAGRAQRQGVEADLLERYYFGFTEDREQEE